MLMMPIFCIRICHCEGGLDSPLITPCYCSGSLRYVHQACLQLWIKSSDIRNCELCKFQFIMETKVKPFNEVIFKFFHSIFIKQFDTNY